MEGSVYSRSRMAELLSTLDADETRWAIAFLTDRAKRGDRPAEANPIWWDKPIAPETLALLPGKRVDLGDDYKELVHQALLEKNA